MEITRRELRGWRVLDIAGEVMFMEIQNFIDALDAFEKEAGAGARLVLNIAEDAHVGSIGLGSIMMLNKRVRDGGGELKLMGFDEVARFRLEQSGNEPPFAYIDSEDEI